MARVVVGMHEAKTHFSRLVRQAVAGDDVVVASGGTPVARIVPYLEHREPRRPGLLAGRIRIADDFNAPLPEFEDAFYG